VQYLLIKLLVALAFSVLEGDLLVREEHEVIDKDLGGFLQRVLRVNGTIRRNLQYKLVVVGLLLNTNGLYLRYAYYFCLI
jgi:hypothetical protein